jgi:hypothetical protein
MRTFGAANHWWRYGPSFTAFAPWCAVGEIIMARQMRHRFSYRRIVMTAQTACAMMRHDENLTAHITMASLPG